MRYRRHLSFLLLGTFLSAVAAQDFQKDIQPLLTTYCLDCHDAETQKGELDLERFGSLDAIAKDASVWEHVQLQVADGEMPPKKKPQFSPEEKARFTTWLASTLNGIALASAGDPGPVVLRRLSNHEYRYSIRDLTGIDSLDPGREFPIDGAAGEGFTNVGAALVMSPGLLTKYLDAAKAVAKHAVLLPDGIGFSASHSRADWTQERLDAIRALYDRYTVPGGETAQNLQGVRFSTVDGGVIPLERYLEALRGGARNGLSPKYLEMLATRPKMALLPELDAQQIKAWRQALWRFAKVGQIGSRDGAKAWQLPVDPLARTQEIRLKIPASETHATLYLASGGNAQVAWRDATLKIPGRDPIPIHKVAAMGEEMLALQARELARSADYLESKPGLNPRLLKVWQTFLGRSAQSREPTGHLQGQKHKVGGYDAVKGWGGDLPILLVNQADGDLSFSTLTVPGRGVTVHPTPEEDISVVWRSPISGALKIDGLVADGDNSCGNGVEWSLTHIAADGKQLLGSAHYSKGGRSAIGPLEARVQQGDLLRLNISAHQRDHTCDTSQIALSIANDQRRWDLASEIVDRIHVGNPMPDSFGNAKVWHFCKSPAESAQISAISAESMLGKWRAGNVDAGAVQAAILEPKTDADRAIRDSILGWPVWFELGDASDAAESADIPTELRIPASLLQKGAEFAARVEIHSDAKTGWAQATAALSKPDLTALHPGQTILVHDESPDRARFLAEFAAFREYFPAALCYRKIVPVDEVVTLTLRYREDHHLTRLMLNDAEAAILDRLWDEMSVISRQPLQQLDAFLQLWQYATQDSDPSNIEPMRAGITQAAEDFKKRLIDIKPVHLEAVLRFAESAWRRPLSQAELDGLRELYRQLRAQELPHDPAIRQLLTRVLVAPAFLYRGETAAPGAEAAPVSDWELATRLSYFLWSSAPDAVLRQAVRDGRLHEPVVGKRMLQDPKIRRLATEFGAQWLHVRDLGETGEKSERHFPSFRELRSDMQEETVRFFMDLFQGNRSILSLLDADHSFVSEALAAHYGVNAPASDWQRIDGLLARGRGGILGFASTLATQSGASRTSPILRGNWVSEVLLGEKLPRPPKDVPVLPEEAPEGLSERQLIERHSSDPACARCHARIDPFGFALEGFDAIGRSRDADSAAVLADGSSFTGIGGLRSYLRDTRRQDFLRQFCRKLLGYALGRSVQLSDKPLIDDMLTALNKNDHRVGIAIAKILRSPQFRHVRGRDFGAN